MKLTTISLNKEHIIAAVCEDEQVYIDLPKAQKTKGGTLEIPSSMLEAIRLGASFLEEAERTVNWALAEPQESYVYRFDDELIRREAPIPVPVKNVMCAGKNYAEHAIEMGSKADIPGHPIIFTKSPTTVIGPDDEIEAHQNVTSALDYEGEIAVIIGKKGRAIAKEEAHDYIFGYTLLNDVTARDLQSRHKQFFLGKSLDSFCPMGPYIVPATHINIDHSTLTTRVNGEIRQESTVDKMIFSIAELLEIISRGMSLEPGDIIATGTPAGVGKGFTPPKYLKGGDEVSIEVDGLGMLKNKVNSG
ncbi:fumarylacetoacetate hydrolase family protein [Alteribacillus sp. HJP-4]|uniref:fumarylacetoacetate hydrolase family protein n=1 Tax=Alteribacillus sp. HJP-4 TaxID=2775394 RepID=UPI0035CD3656